MVQLHPIKKMYPPGYGPGCRITSGARYYCHLERRISKALALRCSITSGARYYCHLGRRISIAWALRYSKTLGARCYCHLGSRGENINSLSAAVHHNFRRTVMVPSREENIKRISIAWAPRYSQARNQAKIPEGTKSFTMKSTRQGSNDGELL